VKREKRLPERILDSSYSARTAGSVLASKIAVSVVLRPRRNGRILGMVADMIDQYNSACVHTTNAASSKEGSSVSPDSGKVCRRYAIAMTILLWSQLSGTHK